MLVAPPFDRAIPCGGVPGPSIDWGKHVTTCDASMGVPPAHHPEEVQS
jgi:hypothetical protein